MNEAQQVEYQTRFSLLRVVGIKVGLSLEPMPGLKVKSDVQGSNSLAAVRFNEAYAVPHKLPACEINIVSRILCGSQQTCASCWR